MDNHVRNTIDQLYTKYYRELYHYSFSLFDCKQQFIQDAEDCVQDTFEKAIRHLSQWEDHPQPLMYLKKMCCHIAITRRRNIRNRRRILGYPVAVEDQQDIRDVRDLIADWIIRQDQQAAKVQLMEQLTKGEKEVYRAYFEKDLSIRDTAESLGISHGAARGSIQRIRAKAMGMKRESFFVLIACIFLC